MKRKKYVFIILLLFISIGFAILSSNLNIVSSIAITEASFDVHFDNITVDDTKVENDTYSYNDDKTEITFNVPLDKPGDYIDYKFYVVNSGTIDASLNSLSVTIPNTVKDYVTCTLTYYNGTNPAVGDLLRRGINKPLKMHIEYNYNINGFLDLGAVTITASLSYKQPQTIDNKKIWNFDYEGAEQIFVASKTGTYKLETWGAQGGGNNTSYIGGYGGYSTGVITLNKNDIIYINVGSMPTNDVGGYNGGGSVKAKYAGGGATHISKKSGLLFSLSSFTNDILIVAGGGGGSGGVGAYYTGGSGGGYIGNDGVGDDYGTGGTQSAGGRWTGRCSDWGTNGHGSFGQGGKGAWGTEILGGGGGGYYGGGTGSGWSNNGSGGGGSGYIGNSSLSSKAMYCYNCQESTDNATKTISTTNVSENPKSQYAKIGNGYAIITYLG